MSIVRAVPDPDPRRQRREFMPIFARRDLVKHLAQTVDIRLRRPGPFRRNETFGADKRLRFALLSYQPDVRQLGDAVYEDDVGGLDVPVNQPVPMQMA